MIQRVIPDLSRPIVYPLIGHSTRGRTEVNYLKKLEKFERGCERSLIETLSRVGVSATVKTDPYSLPWTEELTVTLNGESYINGPYEFYRVARKILKEVLDKDIYSLRFYLFINVVTPDARPGAGLGEIIFTQKGRLEYKFRYREKGCM